MARSAVMAAVLGAEHSHRVQRAFRVIDHFEREPLFMSTFAVIIPAAGDSSRFVGFEQKKPFVSLLGIPIWQRTVDHFVAVKSVVEIVLVLSAEDRSAFEAKFQDDIQAREVRVVSGGACRAASVQNGIRAITSDAEYIAVHDAARPLLTESGLVELFAAAEKHGSVIPGIPVTSTVKQVSADNKIVGTVDRQPLRLAQTPQVFQRRILQNAFEMADDLSLFTDEASLVEASGKNVFVHPGWSRNLKITTADDFRLAEMLLQVNTHSSK